MKNIKKINEEKLLKMSGASDNRWCIYTISEILQNDVQKWDIFWKEISERIKKYEKEEKENPQIKQEGPYFYISDEIYEDEDDTPFYFWSEEEILFYWALGDMVDKYAPIN